MQRLYTTDAHFSLVIILIPDEPFVKNTIVKLCYLSHNISLNILSINQTNLNFVLDT